jgi:hypothetical protein
MNTSWNMDYVKKSGAGGKRDEASITKVLGLDQTKFKDIGDFNHNAYMPKTDPGREKAGLIE